MTEYTGKCVQRLSTGEIYSVQVVDSRGIGNELTPQEYIDRKVKPPLSQLPGCSSGSMTVQRLKDSDLPEWLKRWVWISRGDERHFGQLVGRGKAVVATSSTSFVQPWVLLTKDREVAFVPDDGWDIAFVKDDAV